MKKIMLPLGFGVLSGVCAAVLAYFGNPKNMAICVACFMRDIAGSLGLHQAAAVQYLRPEIFALILGACFLSLIRREFTPQAGSSPFIRLLLGVVMAIGALAFLGCPTRMVLRMAGGDLSAYVGFIGFVLGIISGSFALKQGFHLGAKAPAKRAEGLSFIGVVIVLLGLGVCIPTLFLASSKGPGSMHAPVLISIGAAFIIGALAQYSRLCFAGGIRNIILAKNIELLLAPLGFFIAMLAYNLVTNNVTIAAFGPIAHAQALWNILGLYVVGFAATLLGGCPFRQLILAGQGSLDSALTIVGMLLGTALAHNFNLVASPASDAGAGGLSLAGQIAVIVCIALLVAISVGYILSARRRRTEVHSDGGV